MIVAQGPAGPLTRVIKSVNGNNRTLVTKAMTMRIPITLSTSNSNNNDNICTSNNGPGNNNKNNIKAVAGLAIDSYIGNSNNNY